MSEDMTNARAIELYTQFREVLPFTPCLPEAHYPNTFASHKKRNILSVLFYEGAQSALSEIPNAINDFRRYIRHLDAWRAIYAVLSEDEQHYLLLNHIYPLAVCCLNAPYSLKGRIFYAAASVSHHANWFLDWSDRRPNWPGKVFDDDVKKIAGHWPEWAALKTALDGMNAAGFISETNDYRRNYHHGQPPQIELGHIRMVRPDAKDKDNNTWIFGVVEPLALDALIPLLVLEHARALAAFDAFTALVAAQAEKAPAPDVL